MFLALYIGADQNLIAQQTGITKILVRKTYSLAGQPIAVRTYERSSISNSNRMSTSGLLIHTL